MNKKEVTEIKKQFTPSNCAITRICGGVNVPDICVHPPRKEALEWGANVVVVETGAVPRNDAECSAEWQGFTVADAKQLFRDAGYFVKD